jgi:surface antigen
MKRIIASLTLIALLAGCQQNGMGASTIGGVNKQDAGTVLGGVGGALLGSQFGKGKGQLVGVAAGTLLGAALGNSVGSSLDRADLTYYNQTSQRALETLEPGQTLPWRNPQSGSSGTVTPSKYYQTAGGQYCREYTQTIKVGGKAQEGVGTACRNEDGSWQVQ